MRITDPPVSAGSVLILLSPSATRSLLALRHSPQLDENILLLVDSKNVFQAYKLSSKQISKLCKFELDCAGTSLNPPPSVSFHREQICLVWLYGRMVIVFINEVKGQLHLLSLAQQSHHASDEMEQTHALDLYQPGKYDVSVLDNVLVVHNVATRVSMLFDVRSESKTTITEPLPIGPPLSTSSYAMGASAAAGGGGLLCGASTANGGINFFDPASMNFSGGGGGATGTEARPSPGMSSLAPASFHPYVKWTFLSPSFVWESTGDQQQGNLWTLHINVQQVAFSWPHSKRARLVDFLLKRSTVQAKHLILQIILQIVSWTHACERGVCVCAATHVGSQSAGEIDRPPAHRTVSVFALPLSLSAVGVHGALLTSALVPPVQPAEPHELRPQDEPERGPPRAHQPRIHAAAAALFQPAFRCEYGAQQRRRVACAQLRGFCEECVTVGGVPSGRQPGAPAPVWRSGGAELAARIRDAAVVRQSSGVARVAPRLLRGCISRFARLGW